MQRKIVFNTCNLIDIQYFVDVGFRNDSPRSAGISLSCLDWLPESPDNQYHLNK